MEGSLRRSFLWEGMSEDLAIYRERVLILSSEKEGLDFIFSAVMRGYGDLVTLCL